MDARVAAVRLSQTVLPEIPAMVDQGQERQRHLLLQDERHRKLCEFKLEEFERRAGKAKAAQNAALRHF